MPPIQVEEVRIDEISLHSRNAKKHPENQIRLLEKSIKRFGWTQDVILSSDNICLAGHARIKAAINLGMDTVPCKRTTLTGAEADAYLVTDNRLPELGQWDRDILADLLADLPDDLADLTGFEPVQIENLLNGNEIEEADRFVSESAHVDPVEFKEFDDQMDSLESVEDVKIEIIIPRKYESDLLLWISNGEGKTKPQLGRGLLLRAGLL